MNAPVAKRVPTKRTMHGEAVIDDFGWMRNRDDPDLLPYLEAENSYTDEATSHLAALREAIFGEIKSRVQETDLSAPARWGSWWYGRKTEEGRQYPIYVRRLGSPEGEEQVLLDQNALAEGHEFCHLGVFEVSPDHRLLAYSIDHTGNEAFTLRFRGIETGADLADEIPGTYYTGAWAADASIFFYVTHDEAHRPNRLWRHRLGSPAGDDQLVYEEEDQRFFLTAHTSRDDRFILCELESEITREVRFFPADRPTAALDVFAPRRQGVRYSLEHQGGRWLIVTDENAPNGRLLTAPVERPGEATEVIGHDPAVKLEAIMPFSHHLVVVGRQQGVPAITVMPEGGSPYRVEFDEPFYSLEPGENLEYDTNLLRISYQSFLTPPTVIDVDLDSGTKSVVKETPVLGGYQRGEYVQRREWARARDGTSIPISMVHRAGLGLPAPMLLYGYGAYESVVDPWFSHARISLLDRGVIFAVAHVRGGGEMGRLWYENGKMAGKINTFTDFVACADHLTAAGLTDSEHLMARGKSAGGLLMGAVANLGADRFTGIVAEVPFVDVVNTMADPSIPLTVIEWEEWGNPEDPEQYRWLRGYSPYENLSDVDYPAILATAGLNDPRVAYWEPAKWVAKLRTNPNQQRPILLKTELGAGHGGPSGRYDAWKEEAFILAFILDRLGASK